MKTVEENNNIENSQLSIKAKAAGIIVPDDNPFANDKLNRMKNAEVLTSAVSLYNEGAVMALDGAWGTGKTTFVMMWKQLLKKRGFPVVYYNAWEDDICEEPLVSMVRGFKNEIGNKNSKEYKQFMQAGAKVLLGIATGAVKGFLGPLGNGIAEAASEGMEQLQKVFEDEIDKKDSNLKVLKDFRDSLGLYVQKKCKKGKPLVYFVDELDRCNPDYSVKVLERIKHLFEVPNVVFVLSIDKQQLAYSINGFYGSDSIDSMEYLRRFIDIDYHLPQPEPNLYCDYLFELYGLGNCITKAQDELDFKNAVNYVFNLKNLNLRQVDRIFAILRMAYCSLRTASFYDVSVFFFMAYLKVCEPRFYQEIVSYYYTIQQFADKLENFSVREDQDLAVVHFESYYLGMMASILCCYYGGLEEKWSFNKKRVGTIFTDDGNLALQFKYFNEEIIKPCISDYYRPGSHNKIEFFTEKLDLLSDFNFNK